MAAKQKKARKQPANRGTQLDVQILNDGLHLAMAWGDDWLSAIQGRLSKQYPALTSEQLDEYNTVCQEAMRFGHSMIYEVARKTLNETCAEGFDDYRRRVHSRYPWVNEGNLSSLFSQSVYYSLK
jgi:hypothetical protein